MNQGQELAQRQYVSRLHFQDNSQEQVQSRQPVRRINDSDPFKISQYGKPFMCIFYAGLIAGILCSLMGVILSIIPGTAQEDLIKNELLNANSKWIYDDKQQLMKTFQVQVDLLSNEELINEQFKSISSKSKKSKKESEAVNPIVNRSDMQLKDSLSTYQQKISTGFQFGQSYKSPILSLENAHFESKIDFESEPIIPENNHCLKIKVTDSQNNELRVQGLPNCGGFDNSLPINLVENKTLQFSEMIKMSLCSDELSCEKLCEQNDGISHAIQKKNKEVHLEKKYEIQKQTCTANFAVKEVCLVFSIDKETQNISKFEGGCYKGNYMLFDFESKVNQTLIKLREKEDPFLVSIQHSPDYTPQTIHKTQKDEFATNLYCFGIAIFAILIIALAVKRVSKERQSTKTYNNSQRNSQNVQM
ncbi:transmembrane protein, putative (macronuclear) [Tetrahymena thermophila SB210]|uniref:Transmembrane protein, putative n=1 Tax=Tetrahymena thermophila (strain SB210) TaxID=312017 RepID=Q23BZ9_TETTS|nr:transmembrane protein, putative [Tetrahymena thermophila SB210]EAR93969.1 transmembrane protein, putative [Tetrahymena thermophila SB210]|eukprot:XP_001014214.1 transmembrane protein, putative [Tetrahymena thermophila SB210]